MMQNELLSIQYYYLELPLTQANTGITVRDIEAVWRESGALVVADKSGLWLFANSGGAGPSLPSTARFDFTGYIHYHDNILVILQKGLYEPSSAWKSSRPSTTPSNPHTLASSPASATGSSLRNAQSFSAKPVA